MTDQYGMLAGRIWAPAESDWAGTTEGSLAPHFQVRSQPSVPIESDHDRPPLKPALDRQSILAATLRSLMRRYSGRHDVQFLSLLPTVDWLTLAGPLRRRSLHVDNPAEIASVFAWVLQLLARGQTVVLVLDAAQVAQHFAHLAAELCRPDYALLLVILESPRRDGHDPLLRLLQRLPLTVLIPSDWRNARQIVRRKAIGRHGLAVVVARESDRAEPTEDFSSDPIRRDGETVDVALVTYGPLVAQAELVARRLEDAGTTVRVVNFHEISPMSARRIWGLAGQARRVVVVEPDRYGGAFSDDVRQSLLPVPVQGCLVEDSTTSNREMIATRLVRTITENGPETAGIRRIGAVGRTYWRDTVLATELSPDEERWFNAYRTLGSRGRYLWQWSHVGAELTMLPSVNPELRSHVTETKVLSITLCVILDDIADRGGDPEWLSHLGRVVLGQEVAELSNGSEEQIRTQNVVREMAAEYQQRVKGYPRSAEFADLLAYDHRQYLNALEFSLLSNQDLTALNSTEQGVYLPHGMHMMSFGMLDMMCSSELTTGDVGPLRSVLWHLQAMGGLANQLSTWRRELTEGDFTSQIFSLALEHGDIDLEDLQRVDSGRIRSGIERGRHEAVLLQFWQDHYRRCQRKSRHIRTIDVGFLLRNHEEFLRLHLDSRGYL